MKIEISKQVTETIEVEIPSYHSKWGMHYKITGNGIVTASETFVSISSLEKVHEVMNHPKCTEEEFNNAFYASIEHLTLQASNQISELELQEG